MIAFSKPTLGVEEEEAALRVIRSGWLAAGKEVEAFEYEFSDYIAVTGVDYKHYPYCIFTNSCTSALKIAYKWSKTRVKESGFVPSVVGPRNTFCATYSAAEESGVRYIFADNNHDKENWPRVNMHYGGIKDETRCLIEDSAHRIEQEDSLIGRIRCYSFYATKNMTTGSGGMFVTMDKDIYDYARLQWKDGLTTSTADRATGVVDYEVKAMAGGYDGNDLAAAIGRAQLKKLPEFTRRRNEIRDRYNSAFGQTWTGNHLYPYFVGNEEAVYSLRQYLYRNGIASSYHYPGTGWLGVSLPIYPLLADEEVETVIRAVKDWEKYNASVQRVESGLSGKFGVLGSTVATDKEIPVNV